MEYYHDKNSLLYALTKVCTVLEVQNLSICDISNLPKKSEILPIMFQIQCNLKAIKIKWASFPYNSKKQKSDKLIRENRCLDIKVSGKTCILSIFKPIEIIDMSITSFRSLSCVIFLTYFGYMWTLRLVIKWYNVDIIHYIQYGPVVLSNGQTLMKRVVEQNQTDVVRLQEKSINPVQKWSQISLYNTRSQSSKWRGLKINKKYRTFQKSVCIWWWVTRGHFDKLF